MFRAPVLCGFERIVERSDLAAAFVSGATEDDAHPLPGPRHDGVGQAGFWVCVPFFAAQLPDQRSAVRRGWTIRLLGFFRRGDFVRAGHFLSGFEWRRMPSLGRSPHS